MVVLTAVPTAFQAQVVAARLGADGILWQLRSLVGAPYNIGGVEVLVPADQLAEARDLLLVDEVEAALESADPDTAESAGPPRHGATPALKALVDVRPAPRQRHRVVVRATRLSIIVVVTVICCAVIATKFMIP
jgi:hypothetical protein